MTQPPLSGETDLARILSTLAPFRRPAEYVFVTRPMVEYPGADALIREDEGVTHVVTRDVADELDWPYDFIAAWITLRVHSSLAAVGLTAAASRALADAGISCNLLAGYFHDHLLVPFDQADDAVAALAALASPAPHGG
ncbi:MAG: ACT domain-containing protein [Actinomycetes bacterium]